MTGIWLVLVAGGMLAIPLVIWAMRRLDVTTDIFHHPERHSRRAVVGANVATCVVMAIVFSALPFMDRESIAESGRQIQWAAIAFPKTSLYDATNAWIAGLAVLMIWTGVALFARFAVRTALAKQARRPLGAK